MNYNLIKEIDLYIHIYIVIRIPISRILKGKKTF